jgi:5'-nucleotidase
LMRIFMQTDCCVINSGSLRMDSVINEGEITFGTLKRLMPGDYNLVRLQITGQQLWRTIENGVSKFPALEGRFPIVNYFFT